MLEAQHACRYCGSGYNEVIISSLEWQLNLPWIVEAVAIMNDAGESAARRMHHLFVEAFEQSRNRWSQRTPLLRFDGTRFVQLA